MFANLRFKMPDRSSSPTPLLGEYHAADPPHTAPHDFTPDVERSPSSAKWPSPNAWAAGTSSDIPVGRTGPINAARWRRTPSLKLALMFTLTALVLVSVLQFSAVMRGADAVRRTKISPSAACLGFSPRGLSGVVVAERTYYPANTTVAISNSYLGFGSSSLPAFCRLQLLITTNATAGSFANTEIWLPDASAWNKRMLTVGGGGLAGGGTNVCGLPVFDSRSSPRF